MSNSLHDQLMKAGLVDKKKVQASKKNKHKQRSQKGKAVPTEADEAKLRVQQAKAEKAERDRELNRKQQQEAEKKAVQAQIRQLIEMNRLKNRDGEVAYNFTDQRKIKRIYITEELVEQLSRGQLAIAALDDRYELIPTKVADKIRLRDEDVIIQYNEPQQQQDDEDDPYADYKIPDDLMW